MASRNVSEREIRELIRTLNLPETIMEIFDEKITDEAVRDALENDYSKPYSILDLHPSAQKLYRLEQYKPILELRCSQIIAYDIRNNGFVPYFLEDGIVEPVCLSWDGVFLEEVLYWWENEWSDKEMVYVGRKLGLNHVDKILESLNGTPDGAGFQTFEEKETWVDKMLKELNLKA